MGKIIVLNHNADRISLYFCMKMRSERARIQYFGGKIFILKVYI